MYCLHLAEIMTSCYDQYYHLVKSPIYLDFFKENENNSLNIAQETFSAPPLKIWGGMELKLEKIATSGQLPNFKVRQTKYVNSVNTLI